VLEYRVTGATVKRDQTLMIMKRWWQYAGVAAPIGHVADESALR